MSAIAAPDRSTTQRMDALQRANEIRSKRAQFKRDLKAGRASLPEALVDPPDWLEAAKVVEVLRACPKLGPVKVSQILASCRMSRTKTVGGITDRQRAELVARIGRIREGRPSGGGLIVGMDAQRTRALAGANRARLGRSAVKAQIQAGETTVADVLRDPPASVASMTIFDLLMSQERWGKSRTARLLRIVNIPDGKHLAGRPDMSLTARQRDLIIDVLARDA